jgi:hypothetical protein
VDKNTLKKQLTTKRLDHLGLPAGLYKRYRIADRIDELIPLERRMVRNRSPARTNIFVNKANSFGFSHSKAKGFNAVYGHFTLVLGNV